jgi:hypothetical protein
MVFFVLQLFRGNTDSHGVKVSYLEHPVKARFIRVHVDAWHNHPSLRMEIIGCQANPPPAILRQNPATFDLEFRYSFMLNKIKSRYM